MTDSVHTQNPDVAADAEGKDSARAQAAPALELDCRGLNCPLPILKAKKAIGGIEVGQILKVVATDPGSVADFAAFSRRTGHEIVEQSEGGGEFTFYLRRV